MENLNREMSNPNWKALYRIGGVAPFIAILFYMSQFLLLIIGETYPTSPEGWFALFQRNKLLGLFVLNALDTFSIAIVGLMFLALYIALRQINPSYMLIASFFAFLGIAVFVTTRAMMVSATLNLTDQYLVAMTEAQRSDLLLAWQAITSPVRSTPATTGFLFMAIGGLIISIVIDPVNCNSGFSPLISETT